MSVKSGSLYVAQTSADNDAIDYDGTGIISGGTVWAIGNQGMAQAFTTGSSQSYIMANISGGVGDTITTSSGSSATATATEEGTNNGPGAGGMGGFPGGGSGKSSMSDDFGGYGGPASYGGSSINSPTSKNTSTKTGNSASQPAANALALTAKKQLYQIKVRRLQKLQARKCRLLNQKHQ